MHWSPSFAPWPTLLIVRREFSTQAAHSRDQPQNHGGLRLRCLRRYSGADVRHRRYFALFEAEALFMVGGIQREVWFHVSGH
jgi:hypothetical protein